MYLSQIYATRILKVVNHYIFILFYSADGFKVGFDWTRAAFSPDGQYIAVGSADGSVFIWSIATNMIETILKGHT